MCQNLKNPKQVVFGNTVCVTYTLSTKSYRYNLFSKIDNEGPELLYRERFCHNFYRQI